MLRTSSPPRRWGKSPPLDWARAGPGSHQLGPHRPGPTATATARNPPCGRSPTGIGPPRVNARRPSRRAEALEGGFSVASRHCSAARPRFWRRNAWRPRPWPRFGSVVARRGRRRGGFPRCTASRNRGSRRPVRPRRPARCSYGATGPRRGPRDGTSRFDEGFDGIPAAAP